MPNYALVPPEIIALTLEAGDGPGFLAAAATAWEAVAAGMYAAAEGLLGTLAEIQLVWQGVSSISMAGAVQPYITWMNAVAEYATEMAARAATAVAAFSAARAAIVPSAIVMANRLLEKTLIAANVLALGTLSEAIAATEAEYVEFGAQNAAAMTGWETAALGIMIELPLPDAPEVVKPGSWLDEAAMVGEIANVGLQNGLRLSQQLEKEVPGELGELAGAGEGALSLAQVSVLNNAVAGGNEALGVVPDSAALSRAIPADVLQSTQQLATQTSKLSQLGDYLKTGNFSDLSSMANNGISNLNSLVSVGNGLTSAMNSSSTATDPMADLTGADTTDAATLAAAPGSGGGLGSVSASMGKSASAGALSVPEAIKNLNSGGARAIEGTSVDAAGQARPMMGPMPMAPPMAGAAGGRGGRQVNPSFSPSVMAQIGRAHV